MKLRKTASYRKFNARLVEALLGAGVGATGGAVAGHGLHRFQYPLQYLDERGTPRFRAVPGWEKELGKKKRRTGAAVGALLGAGGGLGLSKIRRHVLTKVEREALPAAREKYLGQLKVMLRQSKTKLRRQSPQIKLVGSKEQKRHARILSALQSNEKRLGEMAESAAEQREKLPFGGLPVGDIGTGRWRTKGRDVPVPSPKTRFQGKIIKEMGGPGEFRWFQDEKGKWRHSLRPGYWKEKVGSVAWQSFLEEVQRIEAA